MSDNGVFKMAATFSMSADMYQDWKDAQEWRDQIDKLMIDSVQQMAHDREERERNGHIGPMHRPGRQEHWQALRPQRRVANLLRNMSPGRPAGLFARSKDYEPA